MKKLSILFVLSLLSISAFAEQREGEKAKGRLVGSFETNSIFYVEDSKTGAIMPQDNFGSNNYLKLDYYQGKFSAGIQGEAYMPVLQGYPTDLTKVALTNYYAQWVDDSFSVTAGTFYEQFGSGLLFRAYEDRTLGMNNALTGARFTYNYRDIVALKAIWGMPRLGMKFTDTQVRGGDISFAISNLVGWKSTVLAVEGSVINRYETISADLKEEGGKPSSTGFSGRVNFEYKGFTVRGEYIDAGERHYPNGAYDGVNDPRIDLIKNGNAQLLELGYSGHGLGVNVTARRLEYMDMPTVYRNTSTANALNYIPALTAQYSYLLMNLNPYIVQPSTMLGSYIAPGEIGGQVDIYYNVARKTWLGGKRGMKLGLNYSTYWSLVEDRSAKADNLLWQSINFTLEKQITRKFKLNFLYSFQEYNESHGVNPYTWKTNIFVADMLYKWTPTISTRLELQYLQSKSDDKDWMAALAEVNFAPHWSLFVSDMYNHGKTKLHYYNAGVSYTKSRTRIQLSYGRNRAGVVCSGGVCRNIPAYTGANLMITTSF
ncbi:MAG: hypothetical protein IIX34_01390 [Alistipes sp.]|jgi:hypothetical protein|nr:hypothetical protein [Alistipes sp.]